MTQPVHHAADGSKLLQVFLQQVAINRIGVERGVCEGNAILIEVVADGNLAAEGVTATVKVHLVVLIVTSLHQHGDVQVGIADGIDDANLETEVGQRDDDAVYLVTMLTKLPGYFQSVFAGLNATAARRRSILRQDDILVAEFADGL